MNVESFITENSRMKGKCINKKTDIMIRKPWKIMDINVQSLTSCVQQAGDWTSTPCAADFQKFENNKYLWYFDTVFYRMFIPEQENTCIPLIVL